MQPSTVESADRCVKSEWALKEQIFLYKYKEGQDLPLHSSTFCSQLDDVANKNQAGAVVVAQLPERLLDTKDPRFKSSHWRICKEILFNVKCIQK